MVTFLLPTPKESEWVGVYDNEDPSHILVVFQASAGMQCRINQHGELVNIEVDADIYQVSPNSNSLALMGPRQRITFVEYSDEGQMFFFLYERSAFSCESYVRHEGLEETGY